MGRENKVQAGGFDESKYDHSNDQSGRGAHEEALNQEVRGDIPDDLNRYVDNKGYTIGENGAVMRNPGGAYGITEDGVGVHLDRDGVDSLPCGCLGCLNCNNQDQAEGIIAEWCPCCNCCDVVDENGNVTSKGWCCGDSEELGNENAGCCCGWSCCDEGHLCDCCNGSSCTICNCCCGSQTPDDDSDTATFCPSCCSEAKASSLGA